MSNTNDETHLLSRREFTVEWALAMLAGATITIAGCGDDDPPTQPTTTTQSDVTGSISANHGHSAVITGALITQGAAIMSVNIQGNATHPHTIGLTAAQVTQIGNRQQVVVTSTTDSGHSHTVTFN